jgi:hypothetical protein
MTIRGSKASFASFSHFSSTVIAAYKTGIKIRRLRDLLPSPRTSYDCRAVSNAASSATPKGKARGPNCA